MLIPLSTDAPLYHYPIATVGLIVVNCVCYAVAGPADPDTMWMLHYGTFNPVEWVLSIFMHSGVGHLIGNMFFLWAFGLIVEGKLGWKSFLFVYLMIGVTQCAVEQTMMLYRTEAHALHSMPGIDDREDLVEALMAEDPEITADEAEHWADVLVAGMKGASCGASAVIFGLLAICMVWAPKNEFHVLMFIFFRAKSFDITIMWYAVWYIGCEALMFSLEGFSIGSPALHLMGAAVGFGVGVLYLKKGWVDCENWDLFRVLTGTYGRYADPLTTVGSHADPVLMFGRSDVAVTDDLPAKERPPPKSKRLNRVNDLIDADSMMEASEELFSLRMRDSNLMLDQKRLKRLCLGLIKASMLDEAELHLEEYVERFPDEAEWARVKMAQVLYHQQRPSAALAALKQVRPSQLSEDQRKTAKKIVTAAKKQIQAGVKDVEPEW